MACTGENFTVTLSSDGVIYSFGRNDDGQLGIGRDSRQKHSIPTPIQNLPKIKQISCGMNFVVCVDDEGTMWSFGSNRFDQLGVKETNNSYTPEKIKKTIPPIQSISCGANHTLSLTNDGTLYSFGRNDFGQLCLGHEQNISAPMQTSFLDVIKINAGGYHSLFQTNNGEIFACGSNSFGQLGLKHNDSHQIEVCPIFHQPPNIIDFNAGLYHSLFLDIDGYVYSTGKNSNGTLGLGHNENQNELTLIPSIPPIKIISSIGFCIYLLDFEGNIWNCGWNLNGQLGHEDGNSNFDVPTKLTSISNIEQIACGTSGYHFLAKDVDNKIFVMGSNSFGQIGATTESLPTELDPKYSYIWGDVVQISSKAKSARK